MNIAKIEAIAHRLQAHGHHQIGQEILSALQLPAKTETLEQIAEPARRAACKYDVPALCGKPTYFAEGPHPAKCEPCKAILSALQSAVRQHELHAAGWRLCTKDLSRIEAQGKRLRQRLAEAEQERDALRKERDEIDRKYREQLWLGHGHTASLYGDDGERQCSHRDCMIDFKRWPLEHIEERLRSQLATVRADTLREAADHLEAQQAYQNTDWARGYDASLRHTVAWLRDRARAHAPEPQRQEEP